MDERNKARAKIGAYFFDWLKDRLELPSDYALAARTKVLESSINHIRKGRRNITIGILVKISDNCGIDLDVLRKKAKGE